MLDIRIVARGDVSVAEVTVRSDTATRHRVTVRHGTCERRAGDHVSTEELVRASFEFLLEREPNTSILEEFDLDIISRYFPEYEREIGKRLSQR
jgi:hypothetical protein